MPHTGNRDFTDMRCACTWLFLCREIRMYVYTHVQSRLFSLRKPLYLNWPIRTCKSCAAEARQTTVSLNSALHPKPQTLNPKAQTLNPETLNPKPQTLNSKAPTLNPETLTP